MQNYIQLAEKNGVTLYETGPCQFCGALTKRGVHECVEIFNLGFLNFDFSRQENHKYRFYLVDAHTLQHPEIHGRWNNHFHLTRLHLIFKYNLSWSYDLSPKLSEVLNKYKKDNQDEYLLPPEVLKRGKMTSSTILKFAEDNDACKDQIENWAKEVYHLWNDEHEVVDIIAQAFLK